MKANLFRYLVMMFVLLGASSPFYGQAGFHRLGQVLARAPGGVIAQVVPNAKINVVNSATGGAATIYRDVNLTIPIDPPLLTADASGQYDYFVPPSYCVTEFVTSPGQGSQIFPNICQTTSVQGAGGINTQIQYNNVGILAGSQATIDAAGNIVSPGSITSVTSSVTGNQTVSGNQTVTNSTIGTAGTAFNFNGVLDASVLCGSATSPVGCGSMDLGQLINQSASQLFAYTITAGVTQYMGTITVAPGIHNIVTPIWIGYGSEINCQKGAILNWVGDGTAASWGTVDGSGNISPIGPIIIAGKTYPSHGNPAPVVRNCKIINHGSESYQSKDPISGALNYTFGLLDGGDPNGVLTPGCGTGASDVCGGQNAVVEGNTISGFNAGITSGDNFFVSQFNRNYLAQNLNGIGDGTLFKCGVGFLASGELLRVNQGFINGNFGNNVMLNCSGHVWSFSQTSIDYGRNSGAATTPETAELGKAAPTNAIQNSNIAGDFVLVNLSPIHCETGGGRCVSGINGVRVNAHGGQWALTQQGFNITGITCSIPSTSTISLTATGWGGSIPSNGKYFTVSGATNCASANGKVFSQTSISGALTLSITGSLVQGSALTPTSSATDAPLLSYNQTLITNVQIVAEGSNYYALFTGPNTASINDEYVVAGLTNCTALNSKTIRVGSGLGSLPYNTTSTQVAADVTKVSGISSSCSGGAETTATLTPYSGYYARLQFGNQASVLNLEGVKFNTNHAMTAYCDKTSDPNGICGVTAEVPILMAQQDANGFHIANDGPTFDGGLTVNNYDGANGSSNLKVNFENLGSGSGILDISNGSTNTTNHLNIGNTSQLWYAGLAGSTNFSIFNFTSGVGPFSITTNALASTLVVNNGHVDVTGLQVAGSQTVNHVKGATGAYMVVGTAAAVATGNCADWDVNGNLIDSGIPCVAPTRGTAVLVSGTVTVSNAAACAVGSSCVYKIINCGKNSSTAIGTLSLGTVTAGTSFVINSLSATATVVTGDLSTVCWQIN